MADEREQPDEAVALAAVHAVTGDIATDVQGTDVEPATAASTSHEGALRDAASDASDDDEEAPYRNDEDTDDDDDDDADKRMYRLHDLVEQGAIKPLRALLPLKRTSLAPRAAIMKQQSNDNNGSDEADSSRTPMQIMATESLLLEKDDMGCLPIHIAVIHQQRTCALHVLQYSEALTAAMLRLKCGDLGTPIVHLILRVGALNAAFATDLITELFDASDASDDTSANDRLAMRWSDDTNALLSERLAAKDDEGNSVFHLCAMYDLATCFTTLAAFYARHTTQSQLIALLEKSNRVGMQPLHAAMKYRSLSVARLLVRNCNVSRLGVTSLQQTPLHVAALANFAAGVALLLEPTTTTATATATTMQTVDIAAVDSHGYTAQALAEKAQFTVVAQLLAGDNTVVPTTTTTDSLPTRTKFYYHPEALRHLPMAYHERGGLEPPPENPERIDTLVDPVFGALRAREFAHVAWDYDIARADIADVLRVHEFHYVDKLQRHCEQLAATMDGVAATPNTGNSDSNNNNDDDLDAAECNKTFALDADTALSLRSYDAATRAAGAVCKAVDDVVAGVCDTAFCIVRPPGHHAGPVGKVVCANDPEGSHGFCLLNNVAIGAAYARAHFRKNGLHRIAIIDFDVHHGNGTEEIVRQLTPRTRALRFATPYGEGEQIVQQYKPWRSADDADNVFFASVHGYGHKDPEHADEHTEQAAWFYPGSGASTSKGDTADTDATEPAAQIHNVGLPFCRDGATAARLLWRRAFRDDVLPKLHAFAPDLIFLSAGFDAHRKENVNWGYGGALLEQDYEWLVRHIKRIANASCNGRIVSVLEGGYNFHARVVSPFARSVAAHARALADPSQTAYDPHDVALEAAHDRALLATYTSTVDTAVHAVSVTSSKKKKHKRVDASGDGDDAGDMEDAHVPLAVSRSKRVRKDVDYVALAAQIAAQQQQKQ